MNYYEKIDLDMKGGIRLLFSDSGIDAKNPEQLKAFCDENGINSKRLTGLKQTHGTDVVNIDENRVGGVWEGDAIVTAMQNTPIMIYVADCVPVAIIDEKKKVAGLAHCGWRGTYGKLSQKLVEVMVSEYSSDLADMKCFIGPSIGPCCYNVGKELVKKFNSKFTNHNPDSYIISDKDYYLDLWSLNEIILQETGIDAKNIKTAHECTCCSGGRFHSYRGDGKTPKRMSMIVQI